MNLQRRLPSVVRDSMGHTKLDVCELREEIARSKSEIRG